MAPGSAQTAATAAPAPVPAAPPDSTAQVRWSGPAPSRGSLAYIIVLPAPSPGDAVVAVRGTLADEPLHFEPDSTGRFMAVGAVPVGTTRRIDVPLRIERSSGITQAFTARLAVAPRRFGTERLRVASQFTAPPDSALSERIAQEGALARSVGIRSHQTPRLWSQPFLRPRDSQITSRFGTGREFNGVIQSRHLGLDFRGESGAPIHAANDGVVALAGDFYYSGRVVYIDHGLGLVTAYLHMSELLVAAGDTVTRGQLIGRVGSSGRVTGPHLHWNVRYGLISVDPASLLALGPP